MGRASRAKKERAPKRDRGELLALLHENMEFLQRSAAAFDQGYESEAKRLAVVLRVLMHDTAHSHSLLGQLGLLDHLSFLDSAEPIDPGNLLPTPGLVIMRMTRTATGGVGDYIAPLGDRHLPPRIAHFAGWWGNAVMKVDGTWSRKQLILVLANQEGGAHVDPALDARYDALARKNGLGWSVTHGGTNQPFNGNVVSVAVRQIAYEVIETLTRESTRFR